MTKSINKLKKKSLKYKLFSSATYLYAHFCLLRKAKTNPK